MPKASTMRHVATLTAETDLEGDSSGRSIPPASTLTAQVYERLRDDIVSGALQPGQKLTLDVLKSRYDLGMTPLREALYRLSASTLVILEDRRGFRVAPISATHLAEVVHLREEAEILLLRDAFKHADVPWESRIVAAFHALQRTADYKFNPGPYTHDWEVSHRAFHFALLSAAQLPMLKDFHLSLWDHVSRYRNLAYSGKRMSPNVFEGHKQLMDAAVARDEELACVLLRRHISFATGHIMEGLFPDAAEARRAEQNSEARTKVEN